MTTKPREDKPPVVEFVEPAADPPPAEHAPVKARKVPDGMCAADDGTPHYGDGTAIPGTQVCSAHEIHFFRDGSPRANPDGSRRAG